MSGTVPKKGNIYLSLRCFCPLASASSFLTALTFSSTGINEDIYSLSSLYDNMVYWRQENELVGRCYLSWHVKMSKMVPMYAVRSIPTLAYWNFGKALYARVLGERVGLSGSNFTVLLL